MGGTSLIFTPVLVRCFLGLELLGFIDTLNSPAGRYSLPPTHPLIRAICDITVAVEKFAQNPAVLAT